ncbi:dermonecrotic toxin domain-containing protein [Pseudomonas neuropathica]|uniref:dermonecrotic toxin domain-containing protein n=1 Tax=Pseudomonas neuropathica TaxID=2730425 RepID=UPI003EBCB6AF
MPDRLVLDELPAPSPLPETVEHLPKTTDDSLLQQASHRWRVSHEGLRQLFAASPALRDSINELLRQQLQLDGETSGLRFAASEDEPEHTVSLTDACAFVVQQPTLESDLDQRCHLSGISSNHPLYALKPLQLLEKLKTLDPRKSHEVRWTAFWEARAPRTPVSRRTRATQLYRAHFEASAHTALANRVITAAQLKTLQQIIDSGAGALTVEGQAIHTEKLALVLSNDSKVKLPGAWVVSVGDPATAAPLLYLPCNSASIQAFNTRAAMQTWLAQQIQIPTGLPKDILRVDYSAALDPMATGASDLFADRHHAQLDALNNTNKGKPGIRTHGARSLVHVDLIDHQRSSAIIVAAPPKPLTPVSDSEMEEKPLFGSLSAGIPLAVRQAALQRQREALERLQDNDGDGSGYRECKEALKALETAEQAGETAATLLLYRDNALDVNAFNTAFSALRQAHEDGLYAEGRLQAALGQLDSAEHDLLKAVLATPIAADRDTDITVASLTLMLTETKDGISTTQSESLKGALVIERQAALSDRASISSLILYWPGTGGGLQRFADRRTLAREVLRILGHDSDLTLQLSPLTTDPLHHCLNELIADFEAKATPLRDKPEQADALEILRQGCLASVQVPVHAARSLAFAHLLEQERSGTLAGHLPGWLIKLKDNERNGLKQNIEAYIAAMRESHALMTLALEPRDDFTRRHLHARLRKDFSLEGQFSIEVELPDSTTTEQIPEAGPGGTRKTTVIVPSKTRSKMSLEDLAQLNIDNVHSVLNDSLSQRLIFLRLEVTAKLKRDRTRLLNGINLTYLRKVLPELDLPKAYEQKIHDAFRGAASESEFVRQHRRESLIEPWRLMLKIQSENARLQKHLSPDEAALLNIAIDADTAEAWQANGKRIVLLPVSLKVGGKDTPGEGPVTLSGVSLIEEQISGVTLLYLPDSHDGQFFRRYATLEAARKGLFTLCGSDKWIEYLANRALQGNVRAHVSRIGQAVAKNFDAIIEVGVRWPASTSFAAHLLDAHMGRLIEAHRGTSRSNDELFFERYALKGPRAFNYIKMALGMVPFVGSVLALYQAWTAANQAVVAFLRGEVADGLAEIESMLLSLIDALMDLLPGEAVASTLSRTTRALTQARQLHAVLGNVAALHGKSQRQARHVLTRFKDYEYEKPISLGGTEPASHGLYRGIYRHADGDFIERQGRVYQVELSRDSRSWRLSGNSRKTYKQPIALDESGQWDTWFGVYGTALEGGVVGGGNVGGRMLDTLDPYWPPVIRQRLPRWLVDRNFRRHHQLTAAADDLADQLQSRGRKSDEVLNVYGEASEVERMAMWPTVEAACVGDIRVARQRYEVLTELTALTQGRKRRAVAEMQSKTAWLLTDRYRRRAIHLSHNIIGMTRAVKRLKQLHNALPADAVVERLQHIEDIHRFRVEIVNKLEQLGELRDQVNHWYERMLAKDRPKISAQVDNTNTRHSEPVLLYLKTSQRLEVVKRIGSPDDASWRYFATVAEPLRSKIDERLYRQYELPNIQNTNAERIRILQESIDACVEFRREMAVWTASYPQFFHLDVVEPLLEGIDRLADRARAAINKPPEPKIAGKPLQRVFITDDNQLRHGVEQWDTVTNTRRYKCTGSGGYEEIYEQGADGKLRLTNPQPAAARPPAGLSLATLVAEAQQRLDDVANYRAKVQRNANNGMFPVDLEHMMKGRAVELTTRADDIAAKSALHPIIQRLRDQASELAIEGRAIRTERSLTSQKPTDGMLDDLIGQNAVEIRKPLAMRQLSDHQGQANYLQEYEVWNITLEPAQLLWYVHFHYRSATRPFNRFERAHLKLPQHRMLTHADDSTLLDSRITQQSIVLRHFEGG